MSDQADSRSLLPWHRACWEDLNRARKDGRLPHALLVTGPIGVGKRILVKTLVDSLLCPRPDVGGFACGECPDCMLLRAGTHPDRIEVGPDPEAKSDEIKVDAVRRLVASDALTAHRGGHKVIVVDPAQQMNVNAANSLLKTLEEPAAGTLLCLICEQPNKLPATIRSRCQTLSLPPPPEPQALEWLRPRMEGADAAVLLRLAHGAPLRALALAKEQTRAQRDQLFAGFVAVGKGERDPLAEAAAWIKAEPGISLEWLLDWVGDLLRLASGHEAPRLVNVDKEQELRALGERIRPAEAHRFLQQVLKARAAEDTTLNPQLRNESLLMRWAQIGAGS